MIVAGRCPATTWIPAHFKAAWPSSKIFLAKESPKNSLNLRLLQIGARRLKISICHLAISLADEARACFRIALRSCTVLKIQNCHVFCNSFCDQSSKAIC